VTTTRDDIMPLSGDLRRWLWCRRCNRPVERIAETPGTLEYNLAVDCHGEISTITVDLLMDKIPRTIGEFVIVKCQLKEPQ
jgi:hypothetical protein